MARLKPVELENSTGETKAVLEKVNNKMGKVPNIFKLMANSPAAVEGYLNFSDALSKGVLDAKTRELIAITMAEANVCEYCLSAHVAIGKSVGLTDEEINKARNVQHKDPKTEAIMQLARHILLRRSEIEANDLTRFREAGLTDAEITEIIANVALNVFTNWFNKFAQTEVDFPKVETAFPV